MAVSFQVTLDANDPPELCAFWVEALGYAMEPPPPGYGSWDDFAIAMEIPESEGDRYRALVDPDGLGPRVFFQKVPEGKAAKNRVHLDLNVGGGPAADLSERRRKVGEAAARLTELGATVVAPFEEQGSYWLVMQDPEGNEFCLQ